MDLFDPKPKLAERFGEDLPDSIRQGQRLTGMTSEPEDVSRSRPRSTSSRSYGKAGTWLSELLPHTAKIADDLCVVKSLFTEAINHDPAITFIQTGSQVAGRPCFGSWVSLRAGQRERRPAGVRRDDLARHRPPRRSAALRPPVGQRLSAHRVSGREVPLRQATRCSTSRTRPASTPSVRRSMLDDIAQLNEANLKEFGDPEIATRIAQYEMAYRMQTSVPELTDLSKEPASTFELYGPDARKPGTYAANCILARRLAERGVRFIQLYHMGWDHHEGVPRQLPPQCLDTDQPSAALIQDLKQRGMLDDTLVIWGGEFGRTVYCQGNLSPENYGRDHHPRCFTVWMAGGGIKAGMSATARPTTSATTSPRTRSTSTT